MKYFKKLKSKRAVLYVLLIIGIERLCYLQTAGFNIEKVKSNLPYNSIWELPIPSPNEYEHISSKLDQHYHFLGSGKQFFAFLSQDGTTVLKLAKLQKKLPIDWLNHIKLPYCDRFRVKFINKRQKNLEKLLTSCKIASSFLKEETGVIYAHLNPDVHWNRSLIFFDKLGSKHILELDKTIFVLQKKAHLFCEDFPIELSLQETWIDALLSHFYAHCKKGYVNTDLVLCRNIGMDGAGVVAIDFGSYESMPSLLTQKGLREQLMLNLISVREWIDSKHPELLFYFDQRCKNLIERA